MENKYASDTMMQKLYGTFVHRKYLILSRYKVTMFKTRSVVIAYNVQHMLHEVHQEQLHVTPMDKTHGLDRLTAELSTQQIKLYKNGMTTLQYNTIQIKIYIAPNSLINRDRGAGWSARW